MAAPSKNFTTIADSSVDGSSPLDTTLVTALRDNGIHDRECIYDPALHTATKAHEHTGVDSAKVKEANLDRSGGPRVFDDFLFDNVSGLWTAVTAAAIGAENGVVRLTGGGSLSSVAALAFKLSGNTLTFEARVKHGASGPIQLVGLADTTNYTAPTNAIYFGYTTSASNWWAQTYNSTAATTTDTGVAISTTAFQKIKFMATPSSVAFYIDDVLKATHTTNIPTANMGIFIKSNGQLDVDYVDCASSVRV